MLQTTHEDFNASSIKPFKTPVLPVAVTTKSYFFSKSLLISEALLLISPFLYADTIENPSKHACIAQIGSVSATSTIIFC